MNELSRKEADKALDLLYGESIAEDAFKELKESKDNNQISDHSMNEKTIIDKVKDRIEEFKEYNGIIPEPELISDNNSDNALPDELSTEDNVPISISNSDRALPDELASEDGVPISKASDETIHCEVIEENVISSHNSEAALNLPHLNDEPISSHNSSRFDVGVN